MKKIIAILMFAVITTFATTTAFAKADKACANLTVVRKQADTNSVPYINYTVDSYENMMIVPTDPPSRFYIRTFWMSAAVMKVEINCGNEVMRVADCYRFIDNRNTTRFFDGITWDFEAPCRGDLIHTYVYITLKDLKGKFIESLKIDIKKNY